MFFSDRPRQHPTLRYWKPDDAFAVLWVGVLWVGLCALMLVTLGQRAAALLELNPAAVLICKLLVIAPCIEELFFRGVVHAALLRCGRRGQRARPGPLGLQARSIQVHPVVANVLTALCFGVAHLATAPWFHALAVVAPALLIGWVYERSRKVWMCVALHSFCNLLWILWGYS